MLKFFWMLTDFSFSFLCYSRIWPSVSLYYEYILYWKTRNTNNLLIATPTRTRPSTAGSPTLTTTSVSTPRVRTLLLARSSSRPSAPSALPSGLRSGMIREVSSLLLHYYFFFELMLICPFFLNSQWQLPCQAWVNVLHRLIHSISNDHFSLSFTFRTKPTYIFKAFYLKLYNWSLTTRFKLR
jgi:hypothetical protein